MADQIARTPMQVGGARRLSRRFPGMTQKNMAGKTVTA
jgi:hypothetical protein